MPPRHELNERFHGHLRRAQRVRTASTAFLAGLTILDQGGGLPVVGAMSTPDQLISQLPPVGKQEQLGMYVDASRVMGLPGSR